MSHKLNPYLVHAVCFLGIWVTPLLSQAQSTGAVASDTRVIYTLLPGDTLSSLAQRFYGDPNFEKILVEENGLKSASGLAVGMRLHIPFASYHRVGIAETWNTLAQHYLGDAKRGFVIAEANQKSVSKPPESGASVLIPYPLRHTSETNETINKIADRYSKASGFAKTLMKYNKLRNPRVLRGQIVLVPLDNLLPTEEAKRWLVGTPGGSLHAGDIQKAQQEVQARMPELHGLIKAGAYHEAIALAHALLSFKELTGNQLVSIHKDLATAAVALDRHDLAIKSFELILKLQPDLELDAKNNAPSVRKALEQAKTKR